MTDKPRTGCLSMLALMGALLGAACGTSGDGPAQPEEDGSPISAETAPAEANDPAGLPPGIEAYLAEQAASGFSGAVLMVREGQILLHQGYGLANRSAAVPVTPDTVFDIGSIAKRFTKAAILKLAAEGRLDIGAPLTEYVDGVPEDKHGITVAQLLDHETGLRPYVETDEDSQEFGEELADFIPLTRDEALQRILDQPLLFTPGTSEAYSNAGYTLLAILVEIVSGQPFRDYVHQELLVPAGLKRTGFYGQRQLWPDTDVAIGYEALQFGPVNSPYYWPETSWVLLGAGGMVSSTGDLHRWMEALRQDLVLPPEAVDQYYGDRPAVQAYAGGNNFGFIAQVIELPAIAGTVVVIGNAEDGRTRRVSRMARHLAETLLGRELDLGPAPAADQTEPGFELSPADRALIDRWGLSHSPTGYQGAYFLYALSRQGETGIRQFIDEHFAAPFAAAFSIEQHLDQFRRMAQDVGAFELASYAQPAPDAIDLILVAADSGARFRATVAVESEPPHRIAGLLLTAQE